MTYVVCGLSTSCRHDVELAKLASQNFSVEEHRELGKLFYHFLNLLNIVYELNDIEAVVFLELLFSLFSFFLLVRDEKNKIIIIAKRS